MTPELQASLVVGGLLVAMLAAAYGEDYLAALRSSEPPAAVPEPPHPDTVAPVDEGDCLACAGTGVVLDGVDGDSGKRVDVPCLVCCGTGERMAA